MDEQHKTTVTSFYEPPPSYIAASERPSVTQEESLEDEQEGHIEASTEETESAGAVNSELGTTEGKEESPEKRTSEEQAQEEQAQEEPLTEKGEEAGQEAIAEYRRQEGEQEVSQRLYTPPTYQDPEVPRVNHYRERMMEHSGLIKIGLIVLGIVCFLIVVLVPLSFSSLDYYEMGFKKSKATGTVDTEKVYPGGLHFTGVAKTFKKFRSDAHIERFRRLTFFNKDKLEVTMTCAVEYFLYPKELVYLHDDYGLGYRPIFRNTLLAAIKKTAAFFKVDEYRLERPKIAKALTNATSVALGGSCKKANREKCSKDQLGLFAEVRYFQLEVVDITKEQDDRFLQQVIETETQDTVRFKQKELLTRKETERIKRITENFASEISQNATAKADVISQKAEAEARAIVEDARNSGLKIIYDTLKITNAEHKKSFDYLRTLLNMKNINLYLGFKTIVAKPGQ